MNNPQKQSERKPAKRIPREQRELQMLEVAAVEFGKRGFEATSMDDIAKACGITKPMLYNYFKSKEGLYAAMINQAGTHLVNSLIAVQKQKDPQKRLHEALSVFLVFVDRYRDSWRMVFSGSQQGNDNQSRIAGYRHQVVLATCYTLAEFRPEGMTPQQADRLVQPYAYSLLGSGESMAQWWLATDDATTDEAREAIGKVIDAHVALVKRQLKRLA